MRVLMDAHHSDLLEAMHKLFEDRLGLECWVASGMDFFDAGYAPYGSHEVAKQFLEGPLAGFHDREYRRATLVEARQMGDWAAIVATMAEQQHGFKRLADEVGARFVVVVGNARQYVDRSLDPLILGEGGIRFHQEFDKDGAFAFCPPANRHSVGSFINIFPLLDEYAFFEEAKALLPEWTFGVHGHHGPDGFIKPTSAIAERMKDYAFAWQDKVTGDGYGHVIHYWAALGRPLIGHARFYQGQIAEDLWEDGVTCIDLDRHSIPEAVSMMKAIAADATWYSLMCHAIRARLDARIDYAREAEEIGRALTLVPA